MAIFYSPSLAGFWDDVFGTAPADAIEITAAEHEEMLLALNSRKIIVVSDGVAAVADRPATVPTKAQLTAHAAAKRYAVEQGGIAVAGVSVATDDRSKALIDGIVGYLADGGASPITFKASSGWVDLDEAAIRAIKQAIGAHIQACFAAEAEVEAAIDDGTITTTAEIDAWAWPSNT